MTYLRQSKLWGSDDPLFPATCVIVGADRQSEVSRSQACAVEQRRTDPRDLPRGVDLPYFNPHSVRNTLVHLGETLCKTLEEFKAWSQNLGHEEVLTTFYSYGQVGSRRQGEIIRGLGEARPTEQANADAIAEAMVRRLERSGRVE